MLFIDIRVKAARAVAAAVAAPVPNFTKAGVSSLMRLRVLVAADWIDLNAAAVLSLARIVRTVFWSAMSVLPFHLKPSRPAQKLPVVHLANLPDRFVQMLSQGKLHLQVGVAL